MLVDTHAHLNFNAYEKDFDEVVKRTLAENIWVINVGSNYKTSQRAVEIAEQYEQGMFAAIGLHPMHVKTDLLKMKSDPEEGGFEIGGEDFNETKYSELAESKKVVAMGEIGLDYYYRPKTKTKQSQFKEKQKQIFLLQLDLAARLRLPVIFHCRMAHADLISILKNYKVSHPDLQGVIHCFTGTKKQAEEYVKMGFYVGINGIIFKLNLDEVVKNAPLERILIETDCPYLVPPQEGKVRNEPIFVKHVVQRVGQLKNVEYEKIAETTTQNARTLFKI